MDTASPESGKKFRADNASFFVDDQQATPVAQASGDPNAESFVGPKPLVGPIQPEKKAGFLGGSTKALSDFFQGSTDAVPEENKKKSFIEIGIGSTGQQQTLEELQTELPDVDMRQEYENDPEGMERLMKLWKEGKVNKKNLSGLFSSLRSKARTSLGIT